LSFFLTSWWFKLIWLEVCTKRNSSLDTFFTTIADFTWKKLKAIA
jgi:hypothetical protein